MLIREESLWTTLQASPLELMEEKSQATGYCNHSVAQVLCFGSLLCTDQLIWRNWGNLGSLPASDGKMFYWHGLFWLFSSKVIFCIFPACPVQLSKTFSLTQTRFHIKSFGFVVLFTQSPQALPTQAKSLLTWPLGWFQCVSGRSRHPSFMVF